MFHYEAFQIMLMAICKKCGNDLLLMRSGLCSACMRAIPRAAREPKPSKKEIKKASPSNLLSGPSGLGSDRLSKTLDVLCGNNLPEKGEPLSTESMALLAVAGAVILYFLFFQRKPE